LSTEELNQIAKQYENAMRAPGYEKLSTDKYVKLGITFDMAKEVLKDRTMPKPKTSTGKSDIKSIEDAGKVLGTEINLDGKLTKPTIKTLNSVCVEHSRLINEYPELQKINIKFMTLVDEFRGNPSAKGSYMIGTITLKKDMSGSNGKKYKSLDGVRNIIGKTAGDFYRHEIGHAVEEQMFTQDERQKIWDKWDKMVDEDRKSGGFGSTTEFDQIERLLSSYAKSTRYELCAEMFNGMASGEKYPDDFLPELQIPIKRILKVS
jgi:hypothetical protein